MAQSLGEIAGRPRHLYIRTFGCQMNEYDSLRVQRLLAPLGYVPVQEIADADVIFLNTCAVREKAEQKVFSFIGRLRSLKRSKPHLKIIAGGCVAQQLGAKLLSRFDHLDIVLGTSGIASVAELLERVEVEGKRVACLPDPNSDDSGQTSCEVFPEGALTAPVTIMQGCNNFCSYCIVPYVRGPERSRPADDILREVTALEATGVREVLLLGQNVNSYGGGLGGNTTFVDLIHRIASETGIARIRFTTSHPKDLTDDLMRCFADVGSLCKHLHLPVQSGSDGILSRMNRGYAASDYLDKIRRLREICPEIALTSDVIVGFPGETEDDFRQTMRLLEKVRFDNLFSFRYSDRPNAKAASFQDKIDTATAGRRLIELQEYQAGITLEKNLAEVGLIREVMIEGADKASKGQMTGRTTHNRIVNLDAPVWIIGKLVGVKITAAYSHSLSGDIILGPGGSACPECPETSRTF
jgi:tRNA-2-methylthio-N6-dimethylallyladenosine synthase